MRDCTHPQIVRYLGAAVEKDTGIVNIFQEWVPGGSLQSLVEKYGTPGLSIDVIASYTRQILLGLDFLHKRGIIHRDIKGGNVLVDQEGRLKLADFGASTKVGALDTTQKTSSLKGTPYFMAPEVLSESIYSRKGDIWAVGCTMLQVPFFCFISASIFLLLILKFRL